jgi:hypothetical protein
LADRLAPRGLSKRTTGAVCLFLLRWVEHVVAIDRPVAGGQALFIHAQERRFQIKAPGKIPARSFRYYVGARLAGHQVCNHEENDHAERAEHQDVTHILSRYCRPRFRGAFYNTIIFNPWHALSSAGGKRRHRQTTQAATRLFRAFRRGLVYDIASATEAPSRAVMILHMCCSPACCSALPARPTTRCPRANSSSRTTGSPSRRRSCHRPRRP